MDDMTDSSSTLFPAGNYEAECIEYDFFTLQKDSDREQRVIKCRMKLKDSGKVFVWTGWTKSDGALKITTRALHAMGWDGKNLFDPGPLTLTVSVSIEHEVGRDGKTYAHLCWINQMGGSMANPGCKKMSTQEVLHLSAEVMARIKALGLGVQNGESRKAREPKKAPPEPTPSSDEIPF